MVDSVSAAPVAPAPRRSEPVRTSEPVDASDAAAALDATPESEGNSEVSMDVEKLEQNSNREKLT